MASLVKNGQNYGLIWTHQGRQCRESLKTDDIEVARRRKARLEHEFWEGTHDPFRRKWYQARSGPGNITVGDAIEEFIFEKSMARGRQGWSEANAEKEGYVMRNFARILGKDRPLSSITPGDLERLYYRDSVRSDHTRNSDYISMNTFLNWAVRRGYIDEKPEFRPKRPQVKVPKFIHPRRLSKLIRFKLAEIEQNIAGNHLYDETRGSYWVPLGWMVLAGTGIRPVELAHLRTTHVEENSIVIGEDFTTKVRSERRVPLLFEARQAVELLCSPHFRSMEPYMAKTDRLLGRKPSHAKRKISEEFSRAWGECFPDQPRRVLYNLKDMFAVRFLSDGSVGSSSGMKLNELREILGHSSLETTQKYLKAIPFGTKLEGTIWDYPPVSI